MRTFKTQDPKYSICVVKDTDGYTYDAFLINSETGKGIPEYEPIFIMQGKDNSALQTIKDYYANVVEEYGPINADDTETIQKLENHLEAIAIRLEEFREFRAQYPESMKNPDTVGVINE